MSTFTTAQLCCVLNSTHVSHPHTHTPHTPHPGTTCLPSSMPVNTVTVASLSSLLILTLTSTSRTHADGQYVCKESRNILCARRPTPHTHLHLTHAHAHTHTHTHTHTSPLHYTYPLIPPFPIPLTHPHTLHLSHTHPHSPSTMPPLQGTSDSFRPSSAPTLMPPSCATWEKLQLPLHTLTTTQQSLTCWRTQCHPKDLDLTPLPSLPTHCWTVLPQVEPL